MVSLTNVKEREIVKTRLHTRFAVIQEDFGDPALAAKLPSMECLVTATTEYCAYEFWKGTSLRSSTGTAGDGRYSSILVVCIGVKGCDRLNMYSLYHYGCRCQGVSEAYY
jgi:hypothetical protein